MNPATFLWAGGLFSACLLLHVLLWRLRHPRRHLPALLAVFFAPAAFLPLALHAAGRGLPVPDLAAVLLLHAALSCSYIQVYPAAQACSPTLWILLTVGEAGPEGARRDEIERRWNPGALVADRVDDLLAAGLVAREGPSSALHLTGRGDALIGAFVAFRRALGQPMGRG